jgi:alpha-L-rhamnosidase
VTSSRPWDLRVEHLDDTIGLDTRAPRLSWKLPQAARFQHAYAVRLNEWESDRHDGEENVLIAYPGSPMASRARVRWQVKVWTDIGESAWSNPAHFELGLLEAADWTGRWIEPADATTGARREVGHRSASLLSSTFAIGDVGRTARLYVTAHGVYELFLNGRRVGDSELTPGFTSYRKRLQVQTYDVAMLLRTGTNELRAIISDGWWSGQVGFVRSHDVWGETHGLLAQLEVDGRSVAVTDEHWRSAPSAIVEADLIEGQHTDLRLEPSRWDEVRVANYPLDNLVASPAPPVRRVEVLRPAEIRTLGPARHVVDLGQNINGWVQVSKLGPPGSSLTLTHGESLDASGDVTSEHLAPIDIRTLERASAGQVDVVISDGDEKSFEPRHTTHGFRYVRIDGHPDSLSADDVAGIVVHSDMRRTGWFSCSDARLNRLHDAAVWSFRDNACDIPTDCPQRERAGWTGDWQVFAPTASFLYDVAGFTTKWLRDLAADQRPDGAVRNFAPDSPPHDDDPVKDFVSGIEGSAGWGDAAVLVPWAMWRSYADREVLAEQWPSMVAWVGFAANAARTGRFQGRIEKSPTPAAHERYLWDSGFHWGEWCEPGTPLGLPSSADDVGIVATAYLVRSAATLAEIARVLDRPNDEAQYAELARRATEAWRTEYIDDDGNVRSTRQADHVRALAFDLVPDELRSQTAARLVELVRAKDTHLDTGFLATPYLLPVLADAGHLDVAYALLFQETAPSWLAMINRGATTFWENWEGIDENGFGSLNHYSKGAVVSFLHEHIAGIQIGDAAGYRHFRVAPRPGGGLTWASGTHDSPHGRIDSSWTIDAHEMRLRVSVPPGTTAEVVLPDGRSEQMTAGTAFFTGSARVIQRSV